MALERFILSGLCCWLCAPLICASSSGSNNKVRAAVRAGARPPPAQRHREGEREGQGERGGRGGGGWRSKAWFSIVKGNRKLSPDSSRCGAALSIFKRAKERRERVKKLKRNVSVDLGFLNFEPLTQTFYSPR